MTQTTHSLGLIKAEYPVLEILEHDENDHNRGGTPDVDNPERHFDMAFNGHTLLHVAEAYRELGKWLDAQYAIEAGEATA